MPAFSIVDAHVHLYDPATIRYGWMDAAPTLKRRVTMEDFERARGAVAVERVVFVEVAADPGQHLDEARIIAAAAAQDPRIAGLVAHAPVERGAAVEEDLTALAALGSVKGVRRLIQGEVDPSIALAPGFVEGVRRLARFGFTFDLCLKHWAMPYAVELVRRCPDVTFVLDHIGKPDIRHGLIEPWRSQIKALAELPNVICKVSGVITEADHQRWTRADVRPYVEHVFTCFGFDRCMFGSDWTVSELTHDYPTWVDILDEILAGTDEADLRQFWRETAIRTYRLG